MKQYKDIITWEDKMESKAERIKQRTIRTIKRTWRPRTAVIAAFLMLTTLIPVLGGCSSQSSQGQQQVPQVDQTPSTASLHEGEMVNLKALLANASNLPPAELRTGLTTAKDTLASLNSQMEEEFANTTEVLNRLDLPEKMQIHQETMAKFQDSKDRLNAALDETIASTDADIAPRAASLYGLVNELSPEEEPQPLGTELPNQLIERDPVAPVLGANIAPAYLAGAPDLTPSDLPVEPTEEDLAPTIDAQHSQEIIDKAAELENDPVKIYEWVRNNIDFEPYYGSKKGATETLAELAGNDMDTASLLIALYRVSGIPARYVTGVIEITADQAMKWTATEVPEAALRLFASGGTPITGIQEGGAITRFQLTHTYSEAYLNYSNYRGSQGDEGPREWIPIDPSYKFVLYAQPELLLNESGININQRMGGFSGDCIVDEDSSEVLFINPSQATSLLNDYIDWQKNNYLQNPSEESFRKSIGGTKIQKQELGMIQSRLPYEEIHINYEERELSESDRYRIDFIYRNSNSASSDLLTSENTIDLANKRITISFHGATENDRNLLKQYEDLSSVPAYLVRVTPTLRIEDTSFIVQSTVMGELDSLQLVFKTPWYETNKEFSVVAGGYDSVCFDFGWISRDNINYHNATYGNEIDNLESIVSGQNTQQEIDQDKFIGEMLNLMGSLYFASTDTSCTITSNILNCRYIKHLSALRVGLDVGSSTTFNIPLSLTCNGTYIDVGKDLVNTVSSNNNNEKEILFMGITGAFNSQYESVIWSSVFGENIQDCYSTVTIFQRALEQGIHICSIDSSNYQVILQNCEIANTLKENIVDQVLLGKVVYIPESPPLIEGWQGTGYSVVDPLTGESGYYISGNIGGAKAAIKATLMAVGGITDLLLAALCCKFLIDLSGAAAPPWFGVFMLPGIIQLGSFVKSSLDVINKSDLNESEKSMLGIELWTVSAIVLMSVAYMGFKGGPLGCFVGYWIVILASILPTWVKIEVDKRD